MAFTGVILAFYSGFLHRLVKKSLPADSSDNYVNMQTDYVFLCLGAFEIISGLTLSYL